MTDIDGFKRTGDFNPKNFCDNQFMKMRHVLEEITNYGDDYKTKGIEIEYRYYADQKYYFVTDLNNEFLYIVTWYKGRGNISCILFQGELIDKAEFEDFYKFLLKEYKNWFIKQQK